MTHTVGLRAGRTALPDAALMPRDGVSQKLLVRKGMKTR